jgi:F-type H+-transporting ATPase subunit a
MFAVVAVVVAAMLAAAFGAPSAADRAAVMAAAALSGFNTLVAHVLTTWGARRSSKAFFTAVLAGTFLRLALVLGAVYLALGVFDLPRVPFVATLLLLFTLFMAAELKVQAGALKRAAAAIFFAGVLAGAPAFAQEPAAAPHQETAPHESAATAAESEHTGGHDDPAAILMHHVTDQPTVFGFSSKHLLFFGIVALLVLVAARMAVASYDKRRIPKGPAALVETIVVFIRDEIAERNIGHGEGARWTPLLASFFFFILTAALVGLLPFSATATGNIAVTAALATISFIAQQYSGMAKHGVVGHFKNLVPHGMPLPITILMIPIEILGMFTKPFALMVRLFANMIAGHMVITALLLLIPLMARLSPYMGIAMAPLAIGLSLFIMILEILVAFIQAYLFTLLTSIFIGMYVHPAH